MRLRVGGSVEGGARRGPLTDLTVTLTGKEDEEEDEDHSSSILSRQTSDVTLLSLSLPLIPAGPEQKPRLPTPPPRQCSPECDVALASPRPAVFTSAGIAA